MHALSLLIFPELKPKRRRLPMISDRGKFNWREKQKRIGGEKKYNSAAAKTNAEERFKKQHRSIWDLDDYLAKELHFPRALPPRNRREAQGCEIKITDELHHGDFSFFLIFL